MAGEFCCGCCLAASLKAYEHDRSRKPVGKVQVATLFSHQFDEPVMDYLDYLLTGTYAVQDLPTYGSLADIFDKFSGYSEIDIRLKERHPDIFHGCLDVFFAEDTLSPEFLEDVVQFLGQIFKHGVYPDFPLLITRHLMPRTFFSSRDATLLASSYVANPCSFTRNHLPLERRITSSTFGE